MLDVEDLHDKQIITLRDSNHRINLSDGAVRSGKTVGFNLRWLDYALTSGPPGDLVMCGKTERTLRRNIINPLKDLLGDEVRPNYGEGEVWLGPRKVYLVGANDERAEQKIRGMTMAGFYGDEISLYPENFFKMTLSRLSVPGAKFFGTTNPEGPYHWLKTDYIDRRHDLNMGYWHFELDDNPFLDPDYVSALKKEYTGIFYLRYILGRWVLAEGSIYDIWDPLKYMGKVNDKDDFTDYIAAIDYGTSNPCTFGLYGFDNGRLPAYLIKEYYYDGSEITNLQKTDGQYADDFEDFIGDFPIECVYVDPSALSFITELKGRGNWWVRKAKNEVIDGIRFVHNCLANNLYYVDESCHATDKGFSSYVWDPNAQDRGEDKPLKQNDHTCDRDRYALFSHFFKTHFKSGKRLYK